MKAADMGNAYAADHIGAYYNEGCYVEKDTVKADEWFQKAFDGFKKAADMGDANAAYNVGVYYHEGYYVEKDTAQANEWFQKAKEMGYTG